MPCGAHTAYPSPLPVPSSSGAATPGRTGWGWMGPVPLSPTLVAVAFGVDHAVLVGDGIELVGTRADVTAEVARHEAESHPRWVWWSASRDARALVRQGIRAQRCWDVAEAHRLLAGGWTADPAHVWASLHGLPLETLPRSSGGDLFDHTGTGAEGPPDSPVRPDGHLRPEAVDGSWLTTPARVLAWARLALEVAAAQQSALLEAGAVPRGPPAGGGAAEVAQGRAHRDDLRLRVAGHERRAGRPPARRVDVVRRGRRADDRPERPAQPARSPAPGGGGPSRPTSSCGPTWARSSPGCSRRCPATGRSPPR